MATVISNSRSEFVQNVIKNYTENRIGQYSKYLDTDPIYVTYYAINMVHSRADPGTDAIQDVTGSSSPIRYNKITKFPIYIKGGFEPDTTFEDGIISNDIDLSEIIILPNTLTPRPYDHIYIELPNMVPFLVRVNGYRNLSIQSNDFFSASGHAVNFGEGITQSIDKLVVENYICVFENIGTQNACFIRSEDYDNANNLAEGITQMTELYNALYFNDEVNSYVYNESFYNIPNLVDPSLNFHHGPYVLPGVERIHPANLPGMMPAMLASAEVAKYSNPKPRKRFKCFIRPHCNIMTDSIYDMYMTKFIMESGLFYNSNNFDSTSAIVYEDLEPLMFDYNFKRSIWHAVMTKDTTLLDPSLYYILTPIRKAYSALLLARFPSPKSLSIVRNSNVCCYDNEYFSTELLNDLKNGRADKESCKCDPEADRAYVNIASVIGNPNKDFNKEGISLKEYSVNPPANAEEELTDEEKIIKYMNDIIYNYIKGLNVEFDIDYLMSSLATPSIHMFEYFPLILYIMKNHYNGYFKQVA